MHELKRPIECLSPNLESKRLIGYTTKELDVALVNILSPNILIMIIQHIPYGGNNWFYLRLVNKKFLQICKQIQDPDNSSTIELVFDACKIGNLKRLTSLLRCVKFDVSAQSNKAIKLASEFGHLEIVKKLLSYTQVNHRDNDNEALKMASKNGHEEVVMAILSTRLYSRDEIDKCLDYLVQFRFFSHKLNITRRILDYKTELWEKASPIANIRVPIVIFSFKE